MLRLGFIEKAKLPELWSQMKKPDQEGIAIRRVSPAIVRGTLSELLVKLEYWCDSQHAEAAELLENMDEIDEDQITDPAYILQTVAAYRPDRYDEVFKYIVHATILNGIEDVFAPVTNSTKPTEDHLKNFVRLFNRNSYGVQHDSILETPKRIIFYGQRQGCVTFVPDAKYDASHADARDNALDLLYTFCRQFSVTCCNDMMQFSRTEHEFDMIKHASWAFNEQLLDTVEAMSTQHDGKGGFPGANISANISAQPGTTSMVMLATSAEAAAKAPAQTGATILAFRPRGT